jgi:hypothetical protein
MKLFRAMREAVDGLPVVGPTARTLGVRLGWNRSPDVAARLPSDLVLPGAGGMSVSPDDLMNLPYAKIPRSRGGRGADPVWSLELGDLGPDLLLRLDRPTHGLVEPSRPMTLQSYVEALERTRSLWRLECR